MDFPTTATDPFMDRTLEERVDHRPTHSHSATKPRCLRSLLRSAPPCGHKTPVLESHFPMDLQTIARFNCLSRAASITAGRVPEVTHEPEVVREIKWRGYTLLLGHDSWDAAVYID